jgi:hypothetical protein
MAKTDTEINQFTELKKSIDLLVLIELCKSGATRDQIREVMGSVNNTNLAKVRAALKNNPGGEL